MKRKRSYIAILCIFVLVMIASCGKKTNESQNGNVNEDMTGPGESCNVVGIDILVYEEKDSLYYELVSLSNDAYQVKKDSKYKISIEILHDASGTITASVPKDQYSLVYDEKCLMLKPIKESMSEYIVEKIEYEVLVHCDDETSITASFYSYTKTITLKSQ